MRKLNILPILILTILALSLAFNLSPVHATYTPKKGDYFGYKETAIVNNGQGNYTGYSDNTAIAGTENMTNIFTNGTVWSYYDYAWTFNDNQGSPQKTGTAAGNFTWSPSTFYYVNRNDSQIGYLKPLHIWFYMNSQAATGQTFYLLNTPMTILDKNYSYQLVPQNRYVQSIHAQGQSSYQRHDAYGKFTATYTWDTYFDPTTGYIIGYSWVEQDRDSLGNGFTYTENLYVTTTSYQLATGTTPPSPSFLSQYLDLIIGLIVFIFIIVIIILIAVFVRRRARLPEHSYDYTRVPTPYAPPAPQNIDLEPKQQPAQQVVVKEVAKVRCKYCGALVDTTAAVCPVCGGPTT